MLRVTTMRFWRVLIAPIVLGLIQSGLATAQIDAADWPIYNRDLNGSRYSPVEQINTDNAANLKLAWSHRVGANATSGG
jgi:glucose dehydrogenase